MTTDSTVIGIAMATASPGCACARKQTATCAARSRSSASDTWCKSVGLTSSAQTTAACDAAQRAGLSHLQLPTQPSLQPLRPPAAPLLRPPEATLHRHPAALQLRPTMHRLPAPLPQCPHLSSTLAEQHDPAAPPHVATPARAPLSAAAAMFSLAPGSHRTASGRPRGTCNIRAGGEAICTRSSRCNSALHTFSGSLNDSVCSARQPAAAPPALRCPSYSSSPWNQPRNAATLVPSVSCALGT
mmetsp:Transcript_13057/g.37932  ORF Transcript_13057/g.37932 Transcript_13057/m.37932 type:complete len:243 (-) Transcript_13057:757-1485(-)